MKISTKKILSVLLVCIMMLAVTPFSSLITVVQASENADKTTEPSDYLAYYEDENGIWISGLNYEVADVVIPDEINGIPVIGIDYAALYNTNINNIKIGNNVTIIKPSAFSYCDNLKSITIGDSVTSIGDNPFKFCTALENISVSEENQSFSNDEYGVLFNKDKSTLIKYSEGNRRAEYTIPESVTTIGAYSFEYCPYLTDVTIGNNVTTIDDNVFYACFEIASITIPANVETIAPTAFNNFHIRSIIVSEENPNYSTDEYGVLFNKDKTILVRYPRANRSTEYTIPDSVITINEHAFNGNELLEFVKIPDSVITINEHAFMDCDGLTNVIIPDSVTTIDKSAFESADSITSLTIGKSVTSIQEKAFFCHYNRISDVFFPGTEEEWSNIEICENNDALYNATLHFGKYGPEDDTESDIPADYLEYFEAEDGIWITGTKYFVENVIIPEEINGITVIGIKDEAFGYGDVVRTIYIPATVTTIEDDAITHSYGLTEITVSSENEYYVSDEYGVLFNKDKTHLLRYPSGNKRTEYVIPDSVVYIPYDAFFAADNLQTITIGANVDITAGEMFRHTRNTNYIVVPENPYFSSNEDGLLLSKDKTEIIQYPLGNTRTEYTIPEYITTIGALSFGQNFELNSVTIGSNVKTIGHEAFFNCRELTTVVIYPGVSEIGNYVFDKKCVNLTDVYFMGTIAEWECISIGIGNDALCSAVIHCTDGEIGPEEGPEEGPEAGPEEAPEEEKPLTFFEKIAEFFRKIAEFFRNLFRIG